MVQRQRHVLAKRTRGLRQTPFNVIGANRLRSSPRKRGPREASMAFYVFILASRRNGTLYIGMTDNLIQRVWMHRSGALPGFTKRYGVKMLVWYEQHETRASALTRERQM